MKFLRTKSK